MGISDLCLGAPRGWMSTSDYREACGERSRSRSRTPPRTPPRVCSSCGTHLIRRLAIKLDVQKAWCEALDVRIWGTYEFWKHISKPKTRYPISLQADLCREDVVPNFAWSVELQSFRAKKNLSDRVNRDLKDEVLKQGKLYHEFCILENIKNIWGMFSPVMTKTLSCLRCGGNNVSINVIEKYGDNQGKALVRCMIEKCKSIQVYARTPESVTYQAVDSLSLMFLTGGKRSGVVYEMFAPAAVKVRGVLHVRKETLIDLWSDRKAQRAVSTDAVQKLRTRTKKEQADTDNALNILNEAIAEHVEKLKQNVFHSPIWMKHILYSRARVAARRVLTTRVQRWATLEHGRAQQMLDDSPCICGKAMST